MKKILFSILLASLIITPFFLQNKTEAQSCEIKSVCVDDKHLGIQTADCKITPFDGKTYCIVSCKDGKCIDDEKPATCVDSDKGKDYYVKGTTTVNELEMFSEVMDSCADSNTLLDVNEKKYRTNPKRFDTDGDG